MSLSLDDVRNKRFRMARKSGYEVLEVDEFVDEVEETFGQLFEENQNLKKQVEALKAAPAPEATAVSSSAPAQKPAAAPQASTSTAAPAPSAPAASTSAPTPSAATQAAGERIVVTTSKEASSAVVRLVEMSTQQSEQLVAEAVAEAEQIRSQAGEKASQVTTEAQNRAQKLEGDARTRAESLDRETEVRRRDMFGDLEQQRDQLASTIAALRGFESTYRSNLTRHLQHQIEVLSSGREEPADPPTIVTNAIKAVDAGSGSTAADAAHPAASAVEGEKDAKTAAAGPSSDTPRLDALLGDQR